MLIEICQVPIGARVRFHAGCEMRRVLPDDMAYANGWVSLEHLCDPCLHEYNWGGNFFPETQAYYDPLANELEEAFG